MAVDLFGPADAGAARSVTLRPAETSDTVVVDSWFQPCDGGPGTGTTITAAWLNRVTGAFRALVRNSGVADTNADADALARAVQSQRMNYIAGAQVAGSGNALTLTLSPKPASWADLIGVPLRVVIASSNSGSATGAVVGLTGTKAIVRRNNAALGAGDLLAGAIATLVFDGTRLVLLGLSWNDVLDAVSSAIAGTSLTRYVRTGGSDANNGLANTDASAYRTPQAAIDEVYAKYGTTRGLIVQMGVAGTYASPASVPKNMVLTIKGDVASNSGYVLDSAGGASRSLLAVDSSDIRLEGVALSPSWEGRHVIDAYGSGSRVRLLDSRFATGSATPGALIRAAANGEVRIDGTLTVVSGGENAFLAVLGGSIVMGAASNVAFSGTPAFTTVASCDAGLISTQGVAITGAATGTRYSVNMNGVIRVNGMGENYFPGDVAGTFANGGVYA